ncbi:hypothetical protein Kfla_3004 [Kribbella flavida DSM 17836]|uniref:Uncharacterized protein n=1 Tax=Kribbella flavida (strain DSM 17836 / JCM 10339 / NBRC 14399) TaxID=479435 RepID=D2Q1T0_KRIFD|nr:hypothetical protein Kfla_3004 [Kribbella flavida DSM 17836]
MHPARPHPLPAKHGWTPQPPPTPGGPNPHPLPLRPTLPPRLQAAASAARPPQPRHGNAPPTLRRGRRPLHTARRRTRRRPSRTARRRTRRRPVQAARQRPGRRPVQAARQRTRHRSVQAARRQSRPCPRSATFGQTFPRLRARHRGLTIRPVRERRHPRTLGLMLPQAPQTGAAPPPRLQLADQGPRSLRTTPGGTTHRLRARRDRTPTRPIRARKHQPPTAVREGEHLRPLPPTHGRTLPTMPSRTPPPLPPHGRARPCYPTTRGGTTRQLCESSRALPPLSPGPARHPLQAMSSRASALPIPSRLLHAMQPIGRPMMPSPSRGRAHHLLRAIRCRRPHPRRPVGGRRRRRLSQTSPARGRTPHRLPSQASRAPLERQEPPSWMRAPTLARLHQRPRGQPKPSTYVSGQRRSTRQPATTSARASSTPRPERPPMTRLSGVLVARVRRPTLPPLSRRPTMRRTKHRPVPLHQPDGARRAVGPLSAVPGASVPVSLVAAPVRTSRTLRLIPRSIARPTPIRSRARSCSTSSAANPAPAPS